jgi:hypothetical protein
MGLQGDRRAPSQRASTRLMLSSAKGFAILIGLLWTVTLGGACARERDLGQSNRSASASGGVHIDSRPATEFGRNGSGEKGGFRFPISGTRLSNGNIVIADLRDNNVRYFSGAGHLLTSFGGTGGGVDSFRAAVWVGQCASDTVFVWDSLRRRIVVLDRNAHYVREFRQPGEPAEMECGRSQVLAVLMSPARLELPRMIGAAPRQLVSLRFVNTRGETLHTIEGILSTENRPLGRGTFFTVAGERLYVGFADSTPIRVYSLKGETVASIPIVTNPPRPPSRELYEEAVSQLVRGLTVDDERQRARMFFLKVPMPQSVPPYSGLFATELGELWQNVSALGDSETILRVNDAHGYLKGEVHIPASLRVFEVGTDYLLGAYRLQSGDEHVVLYRLGGDRRANSD